MLCLKCVEQVVKKLTPNDIFVLHELKDRTTAQTGMTKTELLENLSSSMSIFQLSQALMRCELIDLISCLKIGSAMNYYITANGINVLNILSSL